MDDKPELPTSSPISPADDPAAQSPDGPPVDVFESMNDSEAMVVQGLLDSSGIESALVSLEAPQGVLPGVGGVVIRVAPENAEEARRLIEDYRTANEQAGDEDAIEDVNGPAA